MIYADNAATTKLDTDAYHAMLPYLLDHYGNPSQPYSFGREAKKALKNSREVIAECIGAEPNEIYFTSGGTESDNWAIKGSINCINDHDVLASKIEHHAVLNACAAVEKYGVPVSYMLPETDGTITPEILSSHITNKTTLVSVMLANNEIGTIEPVAALAEMAHHYGALFHTDAVQAVGHIPIDVKKLDVDMLSASGHKFNAPKGIGFLYIKKGTQIKPYISGGAQEFGKRAGTENVAAIVAMAEALKKNCADMGKTAEKLHKMEELFTQVLDKAGIDYIRNGSIDRIPGNINISIKNVGGEMLLHRLDLKGICISTGSACDSVNTQISHVIDAICVPKAYAEGTVRISFGRDNDIEDAVHVAQAIISVLMK